MYQRLTYIGPVSFGIVYGLITALMFLVFGLFGLVFGAGMSMEAEMGAAGMDPATFMGGGIVGVLLGALAGFVVGIVFGIIGAVVYNIVAGMTGGIKMRFESVHGDDR